MSNAEQNSATKQVTLQFGLKIGDTMHKTITLKQPFMGDMMAAEEIAPAEKKISYRMALICQCITAVGSYKGVVTMDLLSRLHPADFTALSQCLDEVEVEGKSVGNVA